MRKYPKLIVKYPTDSLLEINKADTVLISSFSGVYSADNVSMLLERRVNDAFEGIAFYLSPGFDWVLGTDPVGDIILVPTKKGREG